jgi:DNA adenine methylase
MPSRPLPNTVEAAPILRWAGSKRAKARYLASYWRPQFRKYIEPFCGSAALFFTLSPQQAVLSDINRELIRFYRTVASEPVRVYRAFIRLPRSEQEYYELRQQYQSISDDITRAATFYYLNKNCFNGLYRTNKQGAFNVPFSNRRVGRYPSENEFIASCKILSKAKFRCGDFVGIVESAVGPGDFVYLDPPYASPTRRPFREYYPNSFSIDDIQRLGQLLNYINKSRAYFILSYGRSSALRSIAKQWITHSYRVRRHISGFAGARRMATEQAITNIEIT